MKTIFFISVVITYLSVTACHNAQDKINKVSEKVGESGGELIKSVSTGVDKAFNVNVDLAENLKAQGITLGKVTMSNDSTGTDNKVSVYMIFAKDFKGSLMMKAFDNKNLEMGRVKIDIDMKRDDAKFFDFLFDTRTNIDTDSKLTIE